MNQPHKHAAVIKAWADGATIQMRMKDMSESTWCDVDSPAWGADYFEYRIKPEVKTYDINVEWGEHIGCPIQSSQAKKNLRLTFTDNKLTAAEVIA